MLAPDLSNIHQLINGAGLALDVVGVLIIITGAILSTLAFLTPWREHPLTPLRVLQQRQGRQFLGRRVFVVGWIRRSQII